MSKIAIDGLTQSGTRCFMAVPWQHWRQRLINQKAELPANNPREASQNLSATSYKVSVNFTE